MGLLDRASDWAIGKVTKKETIRIPYQQLADMVREKFIKGADDEFLKKVSKTAKGGYFSAFGKDLVSPDEKYRFHVGTRQNNILFLVGGGMEAYIIDYEANKFYQLDKDRNWKKFYKAVIEDVKKER